MFNCCTEENSTSWVAVFFFLVFFLHINAFRTHCLEELTTAGTLHSLRRSKSGDVVESARLGCYIQPTTLL